MQQSQADELLVERIRQGDPDAWQKLIARYEGRLLAFARVRLAAFADAEDVVQEAFVGFLQSLPNYDPSRSLETYLFAILRYKITDLMKKHGARPLVTVEDEAMLDDALAADQRDPETPSRYLRADEHRSRRAELLGDALKSLIEELRDQVRFEDLQVIELSFYVGTRNKDIAALLELNEKAVAGIKFRAIARLKSILESSYTPETPQADSSEITDMTVSEIWRRRRLTCLKRSTLGSYVLGVLEDPWLSYTQFHLDVAGCPMCLANLEDLRSETGEAPSQEFTQRVFQSSAGFLSHSHDTNSDSAV
jgi:RNA polymerase sigma-70 factor (ECF subfamily)